MQNQPAPQLQGAVPPQQPAATSQPAPFCGVPGTELAAMAQAAWGQMEGAAGPQGHPGTIPEQPSISLSAQAELELELSLRGSLLVQQQRRIVQLEDELQRAWAEIDRLRTKIAAVERERQRSDDDAAKQARAAARGPRGPATGGHGGTPPGERVPGGHGGGATVPRSAIDSVACAMVVERHGCRDCACSPPHARSPHPTCRSRGTGRPRSTASSWTPCSATGGRTSSPSHSTWAPAHRRKSGRTRRSSSCGSRRRRPVRSARSKGGGVRGGWVARRPWC